MGKNRWHWLMLSLFVVGIGLQAFGDTFLYGTFDSIIAINPSTSTFGDLFFSDYTESTLTVDYAVDDWTFEGMATFDLDGMNRLEFSADGYLGDVSCRSSLVFYPVGEKRSKTKWRSEATHLYDWGREYFVEWVEAKNVNATSSWYIRVSTDNTNWTTVSGIFDSATHSSGQVSVNMLVRYVEIRPTTGYLNSSVSSPEEVTIAYSKHTWRTRLRARLLDAVTLYGSFTLPNVGTPYFTVTLRGPSRDVVSARATVRFNLLRPSCSFSFRETTATLTFPFGCIEKIRARLKIACTGFEEASFTVSGIDSGLPWLDLSGKVTFSVLSKTVEITPRLNLEMGPCFTVYATLETGASTTEIAGIAIDGIAVDYTWNGLRFSSLSYFSEYRHVPVYGSQDCWESFTIASSGDSCCGGRVGFECAMCFAKTSASLFDWAETDFSFSFDLSKNITVSTIIVVEATGFTYASLEILVEW